MQCRLPKKQTMIMQTFDVMISGSPSPTQGYVEIDGMVKYVSEQTIAVVKGTKVNVDCSANREYGTDKLKITFNGKIVAQDDSIGALITYEFTITDNCTIKFSRETNVSNVLVCCYADITMPA